MRVEKHIVTAMRVRFDDAYYVYLAADKRLARDDATEILIIALAYYRV